MYPKLLPFMCPIPFVPELYLVQREQQRCQDGQVEREGINLGGRGQG